MPLRHKDDADTVQRVRAGAGQAELLLAGEVHGGASGLPLRNGGQAVFGEHERGAHGKAA